MHRTRICWYMRNEDAAPMFIWRDRDSDHPAHLIGATINAATGDIIWARFDPRIVARYFERMSDSWVRCLMRIPDLKNVKQNWASRQTIQRLINHSTWFEKMISLNGRKVEIPNLILDGDKADLRRAV